MATDTIDFIHKGEIPHNRDITYATFVLDYRPLKTEPHRVRITVGGDRLTYNADAGAPAANMLETKILQRILKIFFLQCLWKAMNI